MKNRDLVEQNLGRNTLVGLSNILEASPKVSDKQVRFYKFILTLSKLYLTVFWNVFPPHRKSLNQLIIASTMMDGVAVVSVSFKLSERNAQRKEKKEGNFGRGGKGEKAPATEPRHFIERALHRVNGCEVLTLVSLLFSIKLIAPKDILFCVSHRFYASCIRSILTYAVTSKWYW